MRPTAKIAILLLNGMIAAACAGAEPGDRTAPPDARAFDLSTDEGVQAAYRKVTGSDRHAYIHRPEGIPQIVIVNDRWPDFGDVFQGAFIDGRWYAEGHELRPALATLGWDEADAARRVEIARTWIERSQRYGQVIDEPVRDPGGREDPNAPAIRPPVYEATSDGGVRADFWVVTGWGIAGQPLYAHRTLRVGPAGISVE